MNGRRTWEAPFDRQTLSWWRRFVLLSREDIKVTRLQLCNIIAYLVNSPIWSEGERERNFGDFSLMDEKRIWIMWQWDALVRLPAGKFQAVLLHKPLRLVEVHLAKSFRVTFPECVFCRFQLFPTKVRFNQRDSAQKEIGIQRRFQWENRH